MGAFNLTDLEEEWTERAIKNIRVHPQYDKTSEAAYYDVAILILDSAVKFSKQIRPVCLPNSPSIEADHLAGTAVSVSGWGKTDESSSSASETINTAHISIYNQR